MSNLPRVLFIIDFIAPYRKTFFEKLCSNPDMSILVVHGVKKKEDGRPPYNGQLSFSNRGVALEGSKLGPFNIRRQKGILRILQEWNPDIVISQGMPSMLSNWLAMFWAHLHGAKNIIWHCGWEEQAGNRFSLPLKQVISKFYLSFADKILAYSSKGAGYLSSSLGVNRENITICYNGLEIEPLLSEEEIIRKKGRELRLRENPEEKSVFLYVGGMFKEKQVPLLIAAFQQLQEPEKSILWLVGDGPDFQQIKQLVEGKQLENVKIWGRIIDGVDTLFTAADYLVLPGVGGLALNQALFWGLPCVVSEADGTEDDLVIEGQTGFRFIPNDVTSLKTALNKCLLLTEEQRKSFGAAGRSLVLARSNVNEMVKTFVTTIEKVK